MSEINALKSASKKAAIAANKSLSGTDSGEYFRLKTNATTAHTLGMREQWAAELRKFVTERPQLIKLHNAHANLFARVTKGRGVLPLVDDLGEHDGNEAVSGGHSLGAEEGATSGDDFSSGHSAPGDDMEGVDFDEASIIQANVSSTDPEFELDGGLARISQPFGIDDVIHTTEAGHFLPSANLPPESVGMNATLAAELFGFNNQHPVIPFQQAIATYELSVRQPFSSEGELVNIYQHLPMNTCVLYGTLITAYELGYISKPHLNQRVQQDVLIGTSEYVYDLHEDLVAKINRNQILGDGSLPVPIDDKNINFVSKCIRMSYGAGHREYQHVYEQFERDVAKARAKDAQMRGRWMANAGQLGDNT
ncbi:hypothetical protein CC80DRAFT_504185 [Byssothecium circinans]|uniref:Uncharacterized protein n=1 Tax=Byssothecium circinans TaxID=147558 RepID=A0A6A5TZF8_9PLEO|nr:hypothetical protein CC80DRAFT_504185 [Byssothecium circinans]